MGNCFSSANPVEHGTAQVPTPVPQPKQAMKESNGGTISQPQGSMQDMPIKTAPHLQEQASPAPAPAPAPPATATDSLLDDHIIVEVSGPDGVPHPPHAQGLAEAIFQQQNTDSKKQQQGSREVTGTTAANFNLLSFLTDDLPDAGKQGVTGTTTCIMDPMSFLRDDDPDAGKQGRIHNLIKCGVPAAGNDAERAHVMKLLHLMDEPACPELDILVKLVAEVFGAPHSCVTLFEDKKVWISNVSAGAPSKPNFPLATCPWVFLTPHPTILIVEDLCKDARFCDTVWVEKGVRAYVSSPLVSITGHRLGTICFVDTSPRRVDASTARFMNNISELVVRELEKFLEVPRRIQEDTEVADQCRVRPLSRSLESLTESCVVLVDASVPGMKVIYATDTFQSWTGMAREDALGRTLQDLLDIASAGSRISGCSPASTLPATALNTHSDSAAYLPMPESPKAFGQHATHAEFKSQGCLENSWQHRTTGSQTFVAADYLAGASHGAYLSEPPSAFSAENNLRAVSNPDVKSQALWASLSRDAKAGRRFIISGAHIKDSVISKAHVGHGISGVFSLANTSHTGDGNVTATNSTNALYETALATHNIAPDSGSIAPASVYEPSLKLPENVAPGLKSGALGQGASPLGLPVFDMSFRPMAFDRLDQDTLEIGMPPSLEMRGMPHKPSDLQLGATEEARRMVGYQHIYAVRLHRARHSKSQRRMSVSKAGYPSRRSLHQDTGLTDTAPNSAGSLIGRRGSGVSNNNSLSLPLLKHVPMSSGREQQDAPLSNNSTQIMDAQTSVSSLQREAIQGTTNHPVSNSEIGSSSSSNVQNSQTHTIGTHHSNGSLIYETCTDEDLPLPIHGRTVAVQANLEQSVAEVFSGLVVGHIVGRGGYGVVMEADWHDTQVAVKIQDHVFKTMEARKAAELEISIGQQLAHPNVLRTLAYASALLLAEPKKEAKHSGKASKSPLSRTADAASTPGVAAAAGNGNRSMFEFSKGVNSKQDMFNVNSVLASAVTAAAAAVVPGPCAMGAQEYNPVVYSRSSLNSALLDVEDVFHAMLLNSCNSFNSQHISGILNAGSLLGRLPSSNTTGSGPPISWGTVYKSEKVAKLTTGLPAVNESIPEEGNSVCGETDSMVNSDTGVKVGVDSSNVTQTASFIHSNVSEACNVNSIPGEEIPRNIGDHSGPGMLESVETNKVISANSASMVSAISEPCAPVNAATASEIPAEFVFPQRVRIWTVMEFGDGGTLQDGIDRGWFRTRMSQYAGPDMLLLLKTTLDIARGMEHLHEHGIVHADLSGWNVLLCSHHEKRTKHANNSNSNSKDSCASESQPWQQKRFNEDAAALRDGTACPHGQGCAPFKFTAKISDFGKAHRLTRADEVIRRGDYGTLTHMAPEVLSRHEISQAVDLYALGVLMWSMYTGARPWAGLNHALIMSKVMGDGPGLQFPKDSVGRPLTYGLSSQQAAAAGLPSTDDWFKELAVSCMSHDPRNRPSAAAVRNKLEGLHDTLTACGPQV